ncbi:MAG: ABC transporter ATP-binding protein [Thermoprotei archaeon]|nr:MAG: ABC transporter ATP-binding protein [Thermoprotei archaeon]
MVNRMRSIEVCDLQKSYGKTMALRGLTFSVKEGEIYGLLGPNGAGKTTTLKILVGLLRPDAGVARVCGHDVVRERVSALKLIGYVPENPVCFQNLTVKEFLEFIGSLRRLSKEEVRDAVEYYLNLFEMEGRKGELIGSLSRGMVQKVLVSAALMVKPKVLIMDEPMAGMDPEAQHAFKEEIRRLTSKGVTALISSHLLDMVERFCTRVGIINQGVLVAEGSIDEIRRRAESGEEATLEEVFLRIVGGSNGD